MDGGNSLASENCRKRKITLATRVVPLPLHLKPLALEPNGGGFHLIVHLLGAAQCGLHVVADIFRADYFFEFGLVNQAGGLLAGAAERGSDGSGLNDRKRAEKSGAPECATEFKTNY
jgi:hypothetical protein